MDLIYFQIFLSSIIENLQQHYSFMATDNKTALTEHFAHKILTEYLEAKGFKVTRHAYGLKTAFRAEFENRVDGSSANDKVRTVSFNSEYDALPGIGHACGHNLIAISGVAAAYGVKQALKSLKMPGKVVLFGTPAEETIFGKIMLLEAGAYDDVDICLMIHPSNQDNIGAAFLALVDVDIEYFGRASHASAAPWNGKNALDAAILAYTSVSLLRQQILPSDRQRDQLAKLRQRVESCFITAAASTGCKYKITWGHEVNDVLTNLKLGNKYAKHMNDYGVDFPYDPLSSAGSTDMGNVSYRVPSIHSRISLGTKNGIHTPEFEKDAKTIEAHTRIIRASKCLALTALDVITDDQFYKDVYDEFVRVKPKL
ncbi:5650_t:CDS:10 [Ambispora gerdemannii]|uniref:Peptidase M20 domain-containing protein 2 n=1 Tax=Ambispora gerdemannii TaxID=144530 RepID=A0A9N8YT88_9GLOM|nr:5650_t:CDS:10 [Ambispora gerdemannii]